MDPIDWIYGLHRAVSAKPKATINGVEVEVEKISYKENPTWTKASGPFPRRIGTYPVRGRLRMNRRQRRALVRMAAAKSRTRPNGVSLRVMESIQKLGKAYRLKSNRWTLGPGLNEARKIRASDSGIRGLRLNDF